ncbi:MAG: hypothetical protein AABY22_27790 [Nanoarchaeota archaeon]
MKTASFWKDFQFVKQAIENSSNKKKHHYPLQKLINALEKKWCYNYELGLYNIPRCEAVFPLYDILNTTI